MTGVASAGLTAALLLAAFQTVAMTNTGDTPDNPEPGKQGETMPGEAKVLQHPYSKGVRLIGNTPIDDVQGGTMAWADTCAYIPGKAGVNVIDVRDPRAPKVVGLLTEKGAIGAGETVHAITSPDRKLLAASVYGVQGPKMGGPGQDFKPGDAMIAIYDVSKCAKPKLLLEYAWPARVHTIRLSPNGRRLYGTLISPFTGEGGIQVLDISDLKNPRFLGKFGATRPDGTTFEFAPHEVTVSPDERRIYAGVIASRGDDLNKGIKIFPPNKEGLGPEAGGIYILDNSDIAAGKPDPKMRMIGTAQHAGWHTAMQANIKGVPYLVGSGELLACPGTWPRITNIADEKNPHIVGYFRLEMNRPENCPPATPGDNGIVAPPGTATIHWSDVDDASDTRLGLFTMTWAGLRIVDLRNPASPVEVAYFKPGDSCMTHTRYVKETGQIWFGCQQSGFYVIELKPELRKSLGFPVLRAG
jgi:hypothetical protein